MLRLFECRVEIRRQIRADVRIDFRDARLQRLQDFMRRHFVATQEIAQLGDVERRQIGCRHSTTLVTTKRPLAWRGALRNASSALSPSRGSSSRKTLKMGTACAADSTLLRSSVCNFSAYSRTRSNCV